MWWWCKPEMHSLFSIWVHSQSPGWGNNHSKAVSPFQSSPSTSYLDQTLHIRTVLMIVLPFLFFLLSKQSDATCSYSYKEWQQTGVFRKCTIKGKIYQNQTLNKLKSKYQIKTENTKTDLYERFASQIHGDSAGIFSTWEGLWGISLQTSSLNCVVLFLLL